MIVLLCDRSFQDNIIAFQKIWQHCGSSFLMALDDYQKLMGQPLPEYSTENDEATREGKILHILTLIAGASAMTWWVQVRRRMHGVILYVWLTQEARLLNQQYIILDMNLICRDEYKDTSIEDIRVDIILRIRSKLS